MKAAVAPVTGGAGSLDVEICQLVKSCCVTGRK